MATHLSSTVARERVVPQPLVRALHWLLVVIMVAMSSYSGCKAKKGAADLHGEKFKGCEKERRDEW